MVLKYFLFILKVTKQNLESDKEKVQKINLMKSPRMYIKKAKKSKKRKSKKRKAVPISKQCYRGRTEKLKEERVGRK